MKLRINLTRIYANSCKQYINKPFLQDWSIGKKGNKLMLPEYKGGSEGAICAL